MSPTKPFKDTVTHDKAAARTRRNLWLGLFGTACKLVEARTDAEKGFAEARLLLYVDKLKSVGVEPVPEEE